MNDLDHLLAWGESANHFLTKRLLGDRGDKLLGNLKVDVGFQQGHAHFAQRLLDVFLGQPAVAAKLFKYIM